MKTYRPYQRTRSRAIWTGLLVSAFSTQLLTADHIATYGDFDGTDVMYTDVTESSATDPLPLFGAPSVFGNALDFDPTAFVGDAGSGSTDTTDGQLNVGIKAKPGAAITGISVSETGDFTLVGTGSAATSLHAGLPVFYEVLEVDGVAITPIQGSASVSLSLDLESDPGSAQIWSMALFVDLPAFLKSSGVSYDLGATLVSVVLDDTLVAISEPGTVAFMAKKDFDLATTVAVVPEPTAAGLMLLGGLSLASVLRKR